MTTTLTYNWTWQGGAHRLTDYASTSGITMTFDYDRLGRIQRRYTAQGYSDYFYQGNTDWLSRESWHAAISKSTFDLVYYQYINGRPRWVQVASVSSDWQSRTGLSTYYLQYNWHGDVVTWVPPDGNATNTVSPTMDPWGMYDDNSRALEYYIWNGGWGYLYFTPLKLYYVHGRWYNPETALWLSPDENGSYRYDPMQDAVNGGLIRMLMYFCRRL